MLAFCAVRGKFVNALLMNFRPATVYGRGSKSEDSDARTGEVRKVCHCGLTGL